MQLMRSAQICKIANQLLISFNLVVDLLVSRPSVCNSLFILADQYIGFFYKE